MFHLGILGAGNISETHARAARAIQGVEIAAVYGQNSEKSRRLAEQYGGVAYEDLHDLLAHRPLDVVLVGSPSGIHAEQARAAARQGLHVLVEKPLDITTERIDALIAECERAGVKLGVFFQDRAAPDLVWLKQLVDDGGLGRIFLASARVKWYRPPEYYASSRWRGTWALDGGGALMNQGIHTVDLLLWLLGDPQRVYAQARTALHEIEVEDTVAAVLDFGDAIATFEASTAAYPGFPRRLELTGTKGTMVVEQDRIITADLLEPSLQPPPRGEESGNRSSTSPVVSDARGHQRILEDFLSAIRSNTTPLCSGGEGRRSVAVVEAIYRSARSGVAVAVRDACEARAAVERSS